MTAILFHNPRCSKSRAALALLEEMGQKPEIIEYLKTPYTIERLREICAKAGLTPRQLLRRGEPVYKTLRLDESQSDEALLRAMQAHPVLVERPILLTDKAAIIGRPPERIKALLA